ncbi:hypothetical protein [Streptomyces sp. DH41]|uniref:hypothetical protein n=1 Tax=Streptomyces sp. DH41 TaxID=3040125 RepID=UPI002443147C|nr:hypothetical protein [Streptomyces sp. DH41]MDG9728750.1 hypothetical protein [Streptomyces sp. DH41]
MIEKGGREANFVAGLMNLLTAERAAVGQGVQTALNVPGREELQKPPVPGVADGRQFLGEPPLEQQQLPVSRGQDAALHEQVAQVALSVGLISPGQDAPWAADLP